MVVIAIFATLILVRAFDARKMPALQPWHTEIPGQEFTRSDLTDDFGFEQYLQLEDRLFAELAGYMLDPDDLQGHSPLSRYVVGGSQNPAIHERNWNRSFEITPESPRGGALLIHGLSDSPYSMRSLARLLAGQGFYVLGLRVPGHGTVPAGLLEVSWKDWTAAVKVAARHVQQQIPASQPLVILGYSNGGALAVQHTLESLDDEAYRPPDRLVLLSPAIGITAFARAARWDKMYSFIPYFEKSKWLDIQPEYDPYKYN